MNGLSYKHKFFLLIGLAALLMVVGYQVALKKTIEVYREKAELMHVNQVPAEELNLRLRKKLAEKKELDSLMALLDRSAGETDAIASIVKNADHYQLRVEGISKGNSPGSEVPMECALSGAYVNMVKFIRATEHQPGITVESIRIHKQTDRSTKEEKLILDLWIRKIKKDV